MEQINDIINSINGILFSNYTVYALLFTGVLFTIWSGFGQYRALTHGVAVVRGKYDDKNDPGAINHFQALSAALSATVGLGNIAGVAVAVVDCVYRSAATSASPSASSGPPGVLRSASRTVAPFSVLSPLCPV